MFIIEDFRDAPMRVRGTADTAEEAIAVAKRLGIAKHAYITSPARATLDEIVERAAEFPSVQADLFDAEESLDELRTEVMQLEERRGELIADVREAHDSNTKLVEELTAANRRIRALETPTLALAGAQ